MKFSIFASRRSYILKRHKNTIRFLLEHYPPPARVLDLGAENDLAQKMREAGYKVDNTKGDLDIKPESISYNKYDFVTAFEIFEHLLNPFGVLKRIEVPLFASVPLRLWFAPSYRGQSEWKKHFHEFEDWQFEWLLSKSGFEIKSQEKWTSPVNKIGIRPILRLFYKRHYIVYAESNASS